MRLPAQFSSCPGCSTYDAVSCKVKETRDKKDADKENRAALMSPAVTPLSERDGKDRAAPDVNVRTLNGLHKEVRYVSVGGILNIQQLTMPPPPKAAKSWSVGLFASFVTVVACSRTVREITPLTHQVLPIPYPTPVAVVKKDASGVATQVQRVEQVCPDC